jgi:hypothetical protein
MSLWLEKITELMQNCTYEIISRDLVFQEIEPEPKSLGIKWAHHYARTASHPKGWTDHLDQNTIPHFHVDYPEPTLTIRTSASHDKGRFHCKVTSKGPINKKFKLRDCEEGELLYGKFDEDFLRDETRSLDSAMDDAKVDLLKLFGNQWV